jgi:hypothetical protein
MAFVFVIAAIACTVNGHEVLAFFALLFALMTSD